MFRTNDECLTPSSAIQRTASNCVVHRAHYLAASSDQNSEGHTLEDSKLQKYTKILHSLILIPGSSFNLNHLELIDEIGEIPHGWTVYSSLSRPRHVLRLP